LPEGPLQIVDELAAEHAAQHADRQEEVVLARKPTLAVGRDAACRDHTVDVRMVHQVLAPRMQYGQKANLGPEMLWGRRHVLERFGNGAEQHAVDDALVLQCDRRQCIREREDHVKVGHGEEFLRPRFHPFGPVWLYVKDVLDQLLAGRTDYDQFLPWTWAASHPEAIRTYRAEERRDRFARQSARRASRRQAPRSA